MLRQQKVQIEERDTAQSTKNTHGHLALWSRRTMYVTVCNACVFLPACVNVLTEPWGHQNMPYRELWSASLCCLHLPMQPKSLPEDQILSDKKGQLSLSFIPRDMPAPLWERLCQRRG